MTGAGESYERVSKKEKYYLFSEAIRNRCAWCNGAGTVCIASDRYDHQHTRRTAWYRNPCNSRRLCERSNRSCDGNLDRSSTSLAAVGMAANELGGAGGPLAVLVVTIFAAEFGKLVSKETKIDIIVTPFVTICVGVLLSLGCAPAIGAAASTVGTAIMWATELQPFFMGIIVSVIVGIALTLPISSAAICAALSLTGLAGGAAVAGCCAQMVGFAVMSFKENKWGGLFAQGIGTSMLQMGNIVRNPRIWLPPTLASAITGPVATCIFHLKMNGAAVASGMGTCGLVGQIGVYTGWVNDIAEGTKAAITGMDWAGLVLICFILPAVLSWAIAIPMRKCGWIKENDLKLDL